VLINISFLIEGQLNDSASKEGRVRIQTAGGELNTIGGSSSKKGNRLPSLGNREERKSEFKMYM